MTHAQLICDPLGACLRATGSWLFPLWVWVLFGAVLLTSLALGLVTVWAGRRPRSAEPALRLMLLTSTRAQVVVGAAAAAGTSAGLGLLWTAPAAGHLVLTLSAMLDAWVLPALIARSQARAATADMADGRRPADGIRAAAGSGPQGLRLCLDQRAQHRGDVPVGNPATVTESYWPP